MPRPLTRQQTLENAAFVRMLERSGNIRLAARQVGLAYGTVQHRRRQHPAFAQRVDAALAFAEARLRDGGGCRGPVSPKESAGHRTTGGEPVVVRRRDGKLQMRAAQPGKLTRQCEQAFLSALSATANVRLSAAAAGASVAAFYRRRRKNAAFAREMRLALQTGYDRIELALLESWSPDSHADDAWRHNDPPPVPPMSVDQALMLLQLHQKEARLWSEPDYLKLRRGESSEARQQRDREDFAVAEAARRERGAPCLWEPDAPVVRSLTQRP